MIDRWNSFPQSVMDSSSLSSFKNGPDMMERIKIGFFMD